MEFSVSSFDLFSKLVAFYKKSLPLSNGKIKNILSYVCAGITFPVLAAIILALIYLVVAFLITGISIITLAILVGTVLATLGTIFGSFVNPILKISRKKNKKLPSRI